MPRRQKLGTLADIIILPLKASALTPTFWGLVYMGVWGAQPFLGCALLFSLSFYVAGQIAYFTYYLSQADAAEKAIEQAGTRYNLSTANLAEFFDGDEATLDAVRGEDIQIIVLERKRPTDTPFLNYRAYLQPKGIFKSIVLFSRESRIQKFLLLHEIGHLSDTSHYNALYDSRSALRYIVTYAPLLCLSPTFWVIGLLALCVVSEWFVRGALRREYIADVFAWSRLVKSDFDFRKHAKRMATVFRTNARALGDGLEAIEFWQRERLCSMILESEATQSRGDGNRWIKEEMLTGVGAGIYFWTCTFTQSLATVVAVCQSDGTLARTGVFLIIAFWIATVKRYRVAARAWPAFHRLSTRLSLLG